MKSVEKSLQELMAFCEEQHQLEVARIEAEPEGWLRSLRLAISAAYLNVQDVLGGMTPQKEQEGSDHERKETTTEPNNGSQSTL